MTIDRSSPSSPVSRVSLSRNHAFRNNGDHYLVRSYEAPSRVNKDVLALKIKGSSFGDTPRESEPFIFPEQWRTTAAPRQPDQKSFDGPPRKKAGEGRNINHGEQPIERTAKSARSVPESHTPGKQTTLEPPTDTSQGFPRNPIRQGHGKSPLIERHGLPFEEPTQAPSKNPHAPAINQLAQDAGIGSDSISVFTGVSAPDRAIRQGMRSFPPTKPSPGSQSSYSGMPAAQPGLSSPFPPAGYHYARDYSDDESDEGRNIQLANNAFPPPSDSMAVISAQWSDLYEQRSRMTRYRKQMVESASQLRTLRLRKAKADDSLRRMALLFSESSQPLPPYRSARLLENIQNLEDDCASVEARIEQLGKEMDRREAKLESSEAVFFQHMSAGSKLPVSVEPRPHPEPHNIQSASRSERESAFGHRPPDIVSWAVADYIPSDLLLLGISGDRQSDVHPIYDRLLESIKSLNVARNRYASLLQERDDILRYQKARLKSESPPGNVEQGHGFDLTDLEMALSDIDGQQLQWSYDAHSAYLDKVDLDFLLHFEDSRASAEAVVREWEKYVQRLRDTCFGESIFPHNMPPEEELHFLGDENVLQLPDIATYASRKGGEVTASDVSGFPILLSNPLFAVKQYPLSAREVVHKMLSLPEDDPQRRALFDDSIKEYGILSSLMRSAPGSKSDFINRWILQQLRMSSMDALLLYSTFSGILSVLNIDRWQQDVLYFWARDGTNFPDYFYRGPITRLATSSFTSESLPSPIPSKPSVSEDNSFVHGGADKGAQRSRASSIHSSLSYLGLVIS